jgi:hypothetical protein
VAEPRTLTLHVDRRTSLAGWVAAAAPAVAILATPMGLADRGLLAGAYALAFTNAWWRERRLLAELPRRVTLTDEGRVCWRTGDDANHEAEVVDAWITRERCVLTVADGRGRTRIAVARSAQPDVFRRLASWLRLSRWSPVGEGGA